MNESRLMWLGIGLAVGWLLWGGMAHRAVNGTGAPAVPVAGETLAPPAQSPNTTTCNSGGLPPTCGK